MDGIDEARARLAQLDRPAGHVDRDFAVGEQIIRIEGLSEALARTLEERWGGFLSMTEAPHPRLVVRVVRGDGSTWLPRWSAGEPYRLEAEAAGGPLIVRSYHFALGPEVSGRWRLAVEASPDEPVGRVLDNAARYLVARIAIEQGGLALHGAGVHRGGRAWIFAGASRAGKTTAVRLSRPAESLGDDFAVVLPSAEGWVTHAVPFDNAERAPAAPVRGLLPLGGILRLYQSSEHRLERPEGVRAQASLMSCAAFPWALADVAERAGESVAQIAGSGLYGHLQFAPDSGFWSLLEPPA